MEKAIKRASYDTEIRQEKQTLSVPKPKRLSKAGQWRRDNPDGIFKVIDWQAVNK